MAGMTAENPAFTVSAWNIGERLGYEEDRPAVFEQLKRAACDHAGAVILSEVCREYPADIANTRGVLEDFAADQGYTALWTEYEDATPRAEQPAAFRQHMALLTRLPQQIVVPARMATRNSVAVRAIVDGMPVAIRGAHLDDRSPLTRDYQIHTYLGQINPLEDQILAGDLNSMWRDDFKAGVLRAALQRSTSNRASRLHDMTEDAPLRMLANMGYRDADPRHRATFYNHGVPLAQLDHIMHRTPHFKTTGFTRFGHGPSDHQLIQAGFARR